ncbi:MAG: phospho-N-acetylmuramoyl-pentapeptide-transferase [Spirochaetaceae bacterium]|jgi:phospho-N-acetylmuramoyl-pentapeptide-transferase|nr:phospho-N-acetylmuramoyl-pentapeptide-transferase [Spirochaetaceae bacterium]
MFLEWIYPLVKYFTPLNVIQYLTFRGAYSAITALLICYLFGDKMILELGKLKFGQVVRLDGPQTHLAKQGTPTMGGVFFIFSISVSVFFWEDWDNVYVWTAFFAFIGFGALGFVDDYLKIKRKNSEGVHPWGKLVWQFVVAGAIAVFLYFYGGEDQTALYLPFYKNPVVDMGIWWIPFAMLLVVGESNAVNLADGLDGLATGLILMVFIALAILSYLSGRVDFSAYLGIPYIPGSGELTVLCLAAVGACVGFLWYNAHPAEVIMGDVGSLSMGGLIGVIALIIKKEILMLILGGVFVLEVASVVLQVLYFKWTRWRSGTPKRLFRMAPLHHHFELSGWAETKVVTRFWILGGIFAIIGLSTLKIQ